MDVLVNILNVLGEVIGLKTNFHKSTAVLICCEGIQLSEVLQNLPAKHGNFHVKYLGLPFSTTRLKTVDFQPPVDKAIGKLSSWSGRSMTVAGRLTLVKSVLTSQPVYLLTALKAPKEIMKLIDAKRKQFLWAGTENITGGKCKVNWARSARPRKGGGFGVLHLGKFSKALRPRWLWQEWMNDSPHWGGM